MLGKHMWADMNAPPTTATYSTQDSDELVALPATSKLTNRGKGTDTGKPLPADARRFIIH